MKGSSRITLNLFAPLDSGPYEWRSGWSTMMETSIDEPARRDLLEGLTTFLSWAGAITGMSQVETLTKWLWPPCIQETHRHTDLAIPSLDGIFQYHPANPASVLDLFIFLAILARFSKLVKWGDTIFSPWDKIPNYAQWRIGNGFSWDSIPKTIWRISHSRHRFPKGPPSRIPSWSPGPRASYVSFRSGISRPATFDFPEGIYPWHSFIFPNEIKPYWAALKEESCHVECVCWCFIYLVFELARVHRAMWLDDLGCLWEGWQWSMLTPL